MPERQRVRSRPTERRKISHAPADNRSEPPAGFLPLTATEGTMSSHSFGMHENPFTPGLTLSADETVRLLQSRVSASGGDGERVFPTEACHEVHRWAGGNPEAIWSLAAAAMQQSANR